MKNKFEARCKSFQKKFAELQTILLEKGAIQPSS